jgi:2-alkyl-3-oxoalkanoate reductase
MPHVLVTGGTGTLGKRTVTLLREAGWHVRVLVHRTESAEADEAVHGDVLDPSTLPAAVEGMDAVLHLAARTHARRREEYFELNVRGTENVARAAAAAECGRFVHVSTRAIDEHGGAYSRSKAAAESVARQPGLPVTIVRLPEVYGGGDREGVDRVVDALEAGRRVLVVGRGDDEICPVHVDAASEALVAALSSTASPGRTYTLAGRCRSVEAFAREYACARGIPLRIVHAPRLFVRLGCLLSYVLPLPIYPDQLARLTAPKPRLSVSAVADLGFDPDAPLVLRGGRRATSA